MEYIPRKCGECGIVKSELRDGKEHVMTCACEWKKEFLPRLDKYVGKEYHNLSIMDWKPKIFRWDQCKFPRFLKIQKATAIERLYEFGFKRKGDDDSKVCGLEKSIVGGRNLFIRGPIHSGKGLLVALVKTLAAAKGISSTHAPGDFELFKSEMLVCGEMGLTGADARIKVTANYEIPWLMTLENVKGEMTYKYTGEKTSKMSRAAEAIDGVFARRAKSLSGSVVLTSVQFAKEIGDTIGCRIVEMIDSEKTAMILLLSNREIESLMRGLAKCAKDYLVMIQEIVGADFDKSKKREAEKQDERNRVVCMKEALFFEQAFPAIPMYNSIPMYDLGFGQIIKTNLAKLPKGFIDAYTEFQMAMKTKDGLEYEEGIRGARIMAVQSCSLAASMSEKEVMEIGRMLSESLAPDAVVAAKIENAKKLRDRMI